MVSVNDQYTHVVPQIRQAMAEHDELPNVKLSHFLDRPKELEKMLDKSELTLVREPLSFTHYTHTLSKAEISAIMKNGLQDFISAVLGRNVQIKSAEFVALSHRSFSMILDHGPLETHTAECIIDVTKKWVSGSGGDIVFIPEGGEPVRIEAEYNACVLLIRDKKTSSFYQYVNHKAKGRRQFLRLRIA
ncbi:MAG TPA: hypothetical protein VK158_02525 [Acidobacteriota bacterium]|nr:hypothetical protein [Acidobacteriota bacterium]